MAELNVLEERIKALEDQIVSLKELNDELWGLVTSMEKRVIALESGDMEEAPEKIPEEIPAEEDIAVKAEEVGVTTEAEGEAEISEEEVAVDEAEATADEAEAETETADTSALEDKYAFDDDEEETPTETITDPELLKFFQSISQEVASESKKEEQKPVQTETQNTQPAKVEPVKTEPVKPVIKPKRVRKPGYHLYGYIYYASMKNHGYLYRMREDGTEPEQLTNYTVAQNTFKAKDRTLYFKDINWGNRTIQMPTPIESSYALDADPDLAYAKTFGFTYKGWIYYANPDMGYFLYRVKEDGSKHERLTTFSLPKTQSFRVRGNDLVFYDDFLESRTVLIKP